VNTPTPAAAYWPLTRKVRNALAFASTGDAAAFAGAISGTLPGGYAAAVAATVVSLGAVAFAYWTSDS
jgi:hypothetical protein